MPDVPSWWEAAILAAASYRIWSLLAEDAITDRPRRWLLNLDRDWEDGDDPPDNYRYTLGDFIQCPRCFGFWIVIVTWALWMIWPHATTMIAVPPALSTAVILLAKIGNP